MTNEHDHNIESLAGEKKHTAPATEILPLTEKAISYLEMDRWIDKATAVAFGLGCKADGDIVFPYRDETGAHVLNKFRRPSDARYGKAKALAEAGGKHVLFGSHLCDPSKPLLICAGEYDALVAHQAGVPNATSLPFGDQAHGFIQAQADWLRQFKQIIIWLDNDQTEVAAKNEQELVRRFGRARVRLVRSEFKDANAMLLAADAASVKRAVDSAEWLPSPDLIALAEYSEPDTAKDGITTNWGDINVATGGFRPGEVSIWSGDNNAGKTTQLLNLVAAGAAAGARYMIWSGEQSAADIRYWLELILAGPAHITSHTSTKSGREYWRPKADAIPAMRAWYRDSIYFLNKREVDAESFFAACEVAVYRYGVDAVIIDNLMAFSGGNSDQAYFTAQAAFVQSCKAFAERHGVHIHLVCHNKKGSEFGQMPTKWDVEGSQKITNWADNVLQVWRVPASIREDDEEMKDVDAVLSLCKNRATGELVDCALIFDKGSKRLVQKAQSDMIHASMGWEMEAGMSVPIPESALLMPFEGTEKAVAYRHWRFHFKLDVDKASTYHLIDAGVRDGSLTPFQCPYAACSCEWEKPAAAAAPAAQPLETIVYTEDNCPF